MTLREYKESATFIAKRLPKAPKFGVILGSVLGPLADELEDVTEIPYREVPHFLESTVESHAGKFIYGTHQGVPILMMSGRFHYYEGYDYSQLALPVRVFSLLGVKALILTNAAGAIHPDFQVGDVMILRDHLNFSAVSPMRGENMNAFGPRFYDVSRVYTPKLREIAQLAAIRLGQQNRVHQGVYFYAVGPHFETPAEIRAMGILGGDAVGMSTIPEALTAAHCGLPVLAMSLLTNLAAGLEPAPLSVQQVDQTGKEAAGRFRELLFEIIEEMNHVF